MGKMWNVKAKFKCHASCHKYVQGSDYGSLHLRR